MEIKINVAGVITLVILIVLTFAAPWAWYWKALMWATGLTAWRGE